MDPKQHQIAGGNVRANITTTYYMLTTYRISSLSLIGSIRWNWLLYLLSLSLFSCPRFSRAYTHYFHAYKVV